MEGATGAASNLSNDMCSMCPALTYKQRIIGALCCMGFGLTLDVFATLALTMGKAHIIDYAVFYTLGNVTAICGSGFVVGPAKQLKTMCDPTRRVACTVYLCTMVATLVAAIVNPNVLLIFFMMGIQYCALVWYGASFIPFGRACITKSLGTALSWCKRNVGLDE